MNGHIPRLLRKCALGLPAMVGIHAVLERLKRPAPGKGNSVGLRSYRQRDAFSCGFCAALAVLHTLNPPETPLHRLASAHDLWLSLDPDEDAGVSETRLVRCLRERGVVVAKRTNLTFSKIRSEIDRGRPVITTVRTGDPGEEHWLVIHAYALGPRRVYLSNTDIVSGFKPVQLWSDFTRSYWAERGHGLVCRSR